MSLAEEVGAQIRAHRETRGLTQERLAGLCGVKKASISKLETGKPSKAVQWFLRIAEVFGCDLRFTELKQEASQPTRQLQATSIEVFNDPLEAQNALVRIARASSKEADVFAIHYSGENLNQTILELQNMPHLRQITVLLQHPESTFGEFQYRKIRTLAESQLRVWERVIVKYYREPPSVRGILIDDIVLCIGWYVFTTPSPERPAEWGKEKFTIWGHNTGAILIRSDVEGFDRLRTFFMRVWTDLNANIVPQETLLATS